MCQAGNGLRLSVDADDEETQERLRTLLGKPKSKDGLEVMAPTTIMKDGKGLNPAHKAEAPTAPPTSKGSLKVPGLG